MISFSLRLWSLAVQLVNNWLLRKIKYCITLSAACHGREEQSCGFLEVVQNDDVVHAKPEVVGLDVTRLTAAAPVRVVECVTLYCQTHRHLVAQGDMRWHEVTWGDSQGVFRPRAITKHIRWIIISLIDKYSRTLSNFSLANLKLNYRKAAELINSVFKRFYLKAKT